MLLLLLVYAEFICDVGGVGVGVDDAAGCVVYVDMAGGLRVLMMLHVLFVCLALLVFGDVDVVAGVVVCCCGIIVTGVIVCVFGGCVVGVVGVVVVVIGVVVGGVVVCVIG